MAGECLSENGDGGIPVSLLGPARGAGDAATAEEMSLPRRDALLLRADAAMGIAAARDILEGGSLPSARPLRPRLLLGYRFHTGDWH